LDDAAVRAAAKETGRIVVAEEHLAHGGLGSAVAMSAARQQPVPMRFVNLGDTFAESGTPEGLLKKYGLTADSIVKAARELRGKGLEPVPPGGENGGRATGHPAGATMDPEELFRQLDRATFQPSRIVLDDGRTFDLPIRFMVVVGDTFVDIGIQAPGEA